MLVFEGSVNGAMLVNLGGGGMCVFARELQFQSVREDDCSCVLCESWQGYSWVLLQAVLCLWQPVRVVSVHVSLRYLLSVTTG